MKRYYIQYTVLSIIITLVYTTTRIIANDTLSSTHTTLHHIASHATEISLWEPCTMQRITPQKRDNIFLVCGLSWSLFAAAKLWNINQRCQQYPESCEPIKAYMTLYGCGFLFLSTFVYTLHQLTPLYVRPLHRQTLRIHQDEYDGVYRLYDRHNARQRVSKKAYPALYNYVALSREAFNCPICLHHTYKPSSIYEYFQKNSNTQSVLTCGHAFHTPCITQWMQESNNCPLCKGYISYGVILHE